MIYAREHWSQLGVHHLTPKEQRGGERRLCSVDPKRREPPRMEDGGLLAGQGQYVGNLALPGFRLTKVVRSPHAHALIRGIDVSRAVAVAGVVAVHTRGDLVDDLKPMPTAHLPGLLTPEHHALAAQRVSLVGDPVAVVVATSLPIATDAA